MEELRQNYGFILYRYTTSTTTTPPPPPTTSTTAITTTKTTAHHHQHQHHQPPQHRTWLNIGTLSRAQLSIEGLRDRGVVFVDKNFVGILERDSNVTSLSITTSNPNAQLDILVENQGRINFGKLLISLFSMCSCPIQQVRF